MKIDPEIKEAPTQDFERGWHKQITKNHTCIWSDQWMENLRKNQEREKLEVKNEN